MSDTRIRYLIETRLANWASTRIPALPIAWEGHSFTPPAGIYLQAFMLPANTGSNDLQGTHRLYQGVYQVSINCPSGSGPGAAGGIADEIAALFPMSLRLSIVSPAFSMITTTPCSKAPAQVGDGRYVVPVSFRYRADTI